MAITTESTFLMHVPSSATWSAASETSPADGTAYFTRKGTSSNYTYDLVSGISSTDNPSEKGWYKPSTWAKLVDIKDFSDLGSDPATIDITTLSDHQKKFALGLKNVEKVTCTANYDASDFAALNAISGTEHLAIWFGELNSTPDGSDGKFAFDGEVSVYAKGGGVEAAEDMNITCVVGSEIVFATDY